MGDFQASTDSMRTAATWMQSNVITTATKLQETLKFLQSYALQGDWSQVPSCIAFGQSYTAAIDVYKSVADDLLADATAMHDTLLTIAKKYDDADESSRAEFNARMAALGSQNWMDQTPADQTYADNRPDLHSDNPEQAPDQDNDTGGSSSPATAPSTPAASGTTGAGRVEIE